VVVVVVFMNEWLVKGPMLVDIGASGGVRFWLALKDASKF
jgi:hypothetical protein